MDKEILALGQRCIAGESPARGVIVVLNAEVVWWMWIVALIGLALFIALLALIWSITDGKRPTMKPDLKTLLALASHPSLKWIGAVGLLIFAANLYLQGDAENAIRNVFVALAFLGLGNMPPEPPNAPQGPDGPSGPRLALP